MAASSLLDRFLRYVKVDTQADDRSPSCPSTPGQLVLQETLRRELVELGASDVTLTRYGYVLATIPPTTRKAKVPVVAFLAHVDTAPDSPGKNVKPVVHRKYHGQPLRFADNPSLVLNPENSPELMSALGKDVVTASGTTLLGADDKAGVAAIMTMAETLLRDRSIPHGKLRICFTPDEEIGRGVDKLDLNELGADFAYTLDGSAPGEICWETFSADAASVRIEGVATHTMEAKAKGMVNATHLAGKLLASLPRERLSPESTSGREGFIHPTRVAGTTRETVVDFILRDFELNGLAEKRSILAGLCRGLQAAEPRAKITCKFRKQYRNMGYWLRENMRPVEMAREAITSAGLQPFDTVIRGGTDGSRLTERGLLTPNLFCGEHNAHGLLEWVAVQDMEKAAEVCVQLAECWEKA